MHHRCRRHDIQEGCPHCGAEPDSLYMSNGSAGCGTCGWTEHESHILSAVIVFAFMLVPALLSVAWFQVKSCLLPQDRHHPKGDADAHQHKP